MSAHVEKDGQARGGRGRQRRLSSSHVYTTFHLSYRHSVFSILHITYLILYICILLCTYNEIGFEQVSRSRLMPSFIHSGFEQSVFTPVHPVWDSEW